MLGTRNNNDPFAAIAARTRQVPALKSVAAALLPNTHSAPRLSRAIQIRSRPSLVKSHISQQPSSFYMVAFGNEHLIWLPIDHRNFCCSSIQDGTLALGYGNGTE